MVWGPTVPKFLYTINAVGTGLSLFGSFVMMCLFLRVKKRSPSISVKFILAIAVADFFYSIANLMAAFEDDNNGPLCHLEAITRQFAFMLSIFFATCTARLCYKTSIIENSFSKNRFFRRSVTVGLTGCTIVCLLPLFIKKIVYANGNLMCLITFQAENTTLTERVIILLVYQGIPVLFGLVITIIGYGAAIVKVKRLPKDIAQQLGINVYRLLWYPAVLFITFLPGMIDNFMQIYYGFDRPVAIEAIHLSLTHSIGFTNALVYGLQRNFANRNKQSQVVLGDSEIDNNSLSITFELDKSGAKE